MDGPEKILRTLEAQLPEAASRYVVAFSGGLDSTVLLHALKAVAQRPILAVHVNHGLHPDAGTWAAHCEVLCKDWQIDFQVLNVNVRSSGEGLEAAARNARYAAFSRLLQPGDALLTGHHERDQAETLLLQLLRGAGIAGMAGMPARADFANGWLLRPLLNLSREALEAYARSESLTWLEDPSNSDESLDRNYLRARILPLLRERWPAADSLLARSAAHSAQAGALLDEMARQDLQNCSCKARTVLSVPALKTLGSQRRGNLLRYWLRASGHQAPSAAQLQRIERDLLVERPDAQPCFAQPDYELRRYREQLHLLAPLPAAPGETELHWDGRGELLLPPGCGRLRASPVDGATAGLAGKDFRVCFVRGGERIRPLGSRHHRRLKTLFQEHAVPPWVRMRMPLIYHGQELVAVGDAWLNADYLRAGEPAGWRPQWLDRPPGWLEDAPGQ